MKDNLNALKQQVVDEMSSLIIDKSTHTLRKEFWEENENLLKYHIKIGCHNAYWRMIGYPNGIKNCLNQMEYVEIQRFGQFLCDFYLFSIRSGMDD